MTRTPGEHVPNIKNRSSKHLILLTKNKPVERCVSQAQLEAWVKESSGLASKELARRAKKGRGKTAVR